MGAGGVSPQALLWLSLLGLMALASTLNPDDPNVCSHWERSVSPKISNIQSEITPLSKRCGELMDSPPQIRTEGLPIIKSRTGKGGLLLRTYWGHKSRAMVM